MPHLLGRSAEEERLRSLIGGLPDTGGAVVLLGEAGIGKTALARLALDLARGQQAVELVFAAPESEAGLPFAGLHQLLHPVRSHLAQMRARPRDVLRQAFGMTEGESPDVFAVGMATLELVIDLAGARGLLILVDDAQWLDESSARVLAFVARRASADALAVVFALRAGHPSPLLGANLDTVVVAPLDDGAAASLVRRGRPQLSSREIAHVVDRARGNPLALLELTPTSPASDESAPLSRKVEAAFLARLAGTSDAAWTVLLLAAVADTASLAELETAAGAAGLTVDAFTEAVEEASRTATIDVQKGRLRFRHPLVRSAIISAATPMAVRQSHLALATALEHDPDRAVWHRANAHHGAADDSIGDALDELAERAAARGDPAAGLRALSLAADFAEHPAQTASRRLRSAQIALELGRADLAAHTVASTESSVLSATDAARLALLQLATAPGTVDPRQLERLIDHGRRALEADALDVATSICLAVGEHLDAGGHRGKHAASALAQLVADRFDPRDPRRVVVLASTDPAAYMGEISDAISRIDPVRMTESAEQLVRVRSNVDADRGLAELQRRLLDSYRARGRLRSIAFLQPIHAWVEITLANWPEALRSAEEGTRLAADIGVPRWGTGTLIAEAYIAAVRGDSERADLGIEESEVGATLSGASNVLTGVQLTKGVNHLAQGRYEDAFSAFLRPFDVADPSYHPVQTPWILGDLAEVAAHLGRTGEIRQLFDPGPRSSTTPWHTMAVAYAEPFLASGEEHTRAAFERALAGVVGRWPMYHARLLLEYGSWLRRHRSIAQARSRLRTSVELFDAMAMTPWSERARRELRAAGDEAAMRAPEAWEGLSAQELQVVELAARGLTNREIGERLFLSHRTVGSHLYRSFPKLGVTNRAQLAALFGGG